MKETINPASLYESTRFGFSHAVCSEGGKLLHCAGQVAFDQDGNILGQGDLKKQLEQAFENLNLVLAEVGASSSNIVRLRTYVVDLKPEYLEQIISALSSFYNGETPAPNTLIGVQSLALPDLLVEIEATAMLA